MTRDGGMDRWREGLKRAEEYEGRVIWMSWHIMAEEEKQTVG